jgi:hypothetical protein
MQKKISGFVLMISAMNCQLHAPTGSTRLYIFSSALVNGKLLGLRNLIGMLTKRTSPVFPHQISHRIRLSNYLRIMNNPANQGGRAVWSACCVGPLDSIPTRNMLISMFCVVLCRYWTRDGLIFPPWNSTLLLLLLWLYRSCGLLFQFPNLYSL